MDAEGPSLQRLCAGVRGSRLAGSKAKAVGSKRTRVIREEAGPGWVVLLTGVVGSRFRRSSAGTARPMWEDLNKVWEPRLMLSDTGGMKPARDLE